MAKKNASTAITWKVVLADALARKAKCLQRVSQLNRVIRVVKKRMARGEVGPFDQRGLNG